MMYKSLVAVNHEQHGGTRLLPTDSYAYASQMQTAPVVLAELGKVTTEYPIVFLEQDGRFFPVLLLSFEADRNYFINRQGQWYSSYIPAHIRRYPFMLARTPDDGDLTLCIDETSSLLSKDGGDALFDQSGNPAPWLETKLAFLKELELSHARTLEACAALAGQGLLVPWDDEFATANQGVMLNGSYRVDEAKLNALGGDAMVELRDAGALMLAYAHFFSLAKLPVLISLKQAHDQAMQALATQHKQPCSPGAGLVGGETIKFNF